jgi:SpoVK/Ycf46/Vps4 family AAA+-type ATPase
MQATGDTWCLEVADSTTPLVGGEETSLKKLLFDYLIEPRLPQAPPDAGRRLRWSAVFFGPPGTAKTKLASEIAKDLSWPLITIETSDLLALGVDRMAHQAGLVFRKFEQLRDVVIFIDEVEEFVRTRSDEDRQSRLTTTAMLTLIQGLRALERSILILATNHVDKFDPAIIRPGRFDLLVLIRPPSVESKTKSLQEVLKGNARVIAAQVLRKRAKVVERFTFTEWENFVERCRTANQNQSITARQLEKYLDEADSALAIDKKEWNRWKGHKSRIS